MPGLNPTAQAMRLLRWQTFQEVTWGTAAAATARWMTVKEWPEFKPYRKSTIYPEARGSLAPGFVASQLKRGGEWKVGGYASFEDLPYYLQSVFGAVSAASQGGGFWRYTYTGPTTAQPTLQPYTIEYNQNSYAVRATGCIGQKLSIKGEAEKQLEWDLNGQAQDIDDTWAGPLTTLNDRTITPVIVPVTNVWLDASGSAAMGTNQYANTLLGFTYNVENQAKLIWTAGSLTPQNWVVGLGYKVDLEMDLLWTTPVRNFVNSYMFANVNSLIQLQASSGSNQFTIQMAGQLTDDPALFGLKDGAQIVKLKLSGIYDTNFAGYNTLLVQSGASVIA